MVRSYLGLGSNIGDEINAMAKAIRLIGESSRIIRVSPVYKTAPWGFKDQPAFHNACVAIDTKLEPQQLLSLCQEVEKSLLRTKTVRWGPRTIDVDILTYADKTFALPDLMVPHPRITERQFVLQPLCDIAPELTINGTSVSQWLNKLETLEELTPLSLSENWWQSGRD